MSAHDGTGHDRAAKHKTDKKKPIDLSTPKRGEDGRYSRPERSTQTADEFGTMNLGDGHKLRLDGSRKSKDAVHDATGFDQDPRSTNFRNLAPAQKNSPPPYVGFTLTKPMQE